PAQQDRKLVAADPEAAVATAHGAAQPLTGPGDRAVARAVPEGVVDHLEIVDVDQDQRQRCAVPGRERGLPAQLDLELASIAETRHHVGRRLSLRSPQPFAELQLARAALYQGLQLRRQDRPPK